MLNLKITTLDQHKITIQNNSIFLIVKQARNACNSQYNAHSRFNTNQARLEKSTELKTFLMVQIP